MSFVSTWTESWQDPAMRHAILVHFPIVIAVLLIPLSFAAMVWRGSGRTALTVLSLIGCLLLIGSAFFAKQAGGEAYDALGPAVAPQISEAIGEHATAAVRVWWLGCISGGLLILSCIGKPGWKHTFRLAFFLASVALTVYVAFVADLGGRLVYKDGVGIPTGTAGTASHTTTENAGP
jgi:uncharacterized membrane protein